MLCLIAIIFTFPILHMAAIVAKSRVIILPGNGCSPVANANWYSSLRSQILKKQSEFSECLLRDMPDPDEAYGMYQPHQYTQLTDTL